MIPNIFFSDDVHCLDPAKWLQGLNGIDTALVTRVLAATALEASDVDI